MCLCTGLLCRQIPASSGGCGPRQCQHPRRSRSGRPRAHAGVGAVAHMPRHSGICPPCKKADNSSPIGIQCEWTAGSRFWQSKFPLLEEKQDGLMAVEKCCQDLDPTQHAKLLATDSDNVPAAATEIVATGTAERLHSLVHDNVPPPPTGTPAAGGGRAGMDMAGGCATAGGCAAAGRTAGCLHKPQVMCAFISAAMPLSPPHRAAVTACDMGRRRKSCCEAGNERFY